MTLTFPVAITEAPPIAPEQPNIPTPDKRRRVLIIDDEPAIANTMARILRRYTTVVCNRGDKALELLEAQDFDVILCDINMPNVSGIDIYETITKKAPSIKNRFLFMTGGTFTKRSQEFLESIQPVVLEKPGSMKEILGKVEGIINRQLQVDR